jgi:formylmethanofuran dehydrogenase subunit B
VKQSSADSSGTGGGQCVCTACPLLCDDILINADRVERACVTGRKAITAALACDPVPPGGRPAPEAWENARSLRLGIALQRAVEMLSSARRVLVTGLASGTLEAITAACDLAELLGAAVDAGLPESAQAAGPTIARAGEVTAVWEELRDRADLVVFWNCDPAGSHPRFLERFVAPPLADGRSRRTVAVGPDSVMPDGDRHRHLMLAGDLAVESARCLQLQIAGRHLPDTLDERLRNVCAELHEMIHAATSVAIVTSDGDDPVGLEPWSIVHLVRTIVHEKQAFQIPLGAGLAGGAANVAGAAAVCTWRYGAAGGVARADRLGGLFLPAESDARRLIDRGEVDAVVVLGRLSGLLEQAIADRGDGLSLLRICDAQEPLLRPFGQTVQLRCASGLIATSGTMLREDGRRVVLTPHRSASAPPLLELLADLTAAVRLAIALPAAGGQA